MTASGLPGGAALRVVAAMSLRRARRSRMLWISVAVAGLLVLSALAALLGGRGGRELFDGVLDLLLRYVTPFVLLIHASAAVSEEVQGRTLTYLFSRPIPRWSLPLGKGLAAAGLAAALLCPTLVLVYIVSLLGDPGEIVSELPRLGRGLAALLLAILLFGALATAFGTMVTSYSFVAALAYVLMIEVGFALVPGWLKVVAMTVHLRVVAGLYHPETTLFMTDPELGVPAALAVVVAETLVWAVVAASWVSSTEYRIDK